MREDTAGLEPTVAEPPPRLVREWAVCALVAGVARFVPVPLLDDAMAVRATRAAVWRTLRAQGRAFPTSAVEPLYLTRGGFGRSVASVVRRVALFPVRKYTKILGAVHGVPTDTTRVLLLGRALHRRLALGELAGTDVAALGREAERLRKAFDTVFDEMDLSLLTGVLRDSLRGVRGLTRAVVRVARSRFARSSRTGDGSEAVASTGAVAAGADRVEVALRRPEVVRLLTEFDRRMDARVNGGDGRAPLARRQ